MTQVTDAAREHVPVRSRITAANFHDLIALPPRARDEILRDSPPAELSQLCAISRHEMGTSFGLWQDDPVGFVVRVLGETLWSKQRRILEQLQIRRRVIVPSAVGLGKTHLAARAVAHAACCWPVGTATTVTMATRMRQVEKLLWPHIRRLHARAKLPGRCDMTQWLMPDMNAVDTPVAYGFTAQAHDEAAMQGIHSVGRLLLVMDEAGGIDRAVGRATRNLLTGDAHLLAIGNPATDDENTWFEDVALQGDDPDRPDTTTVVISAYDSPAVTGEEVWCRECPPMIEPHYIGRHLNDEAWINDTIADYGESDPYVVAKVHAKFPKGGASRAIPSSWVDAATEAPDPDECVLLSDLGLEEETRPVPVLPGSWVRLGVDVAADGGDEFCIVRMVGDVPTLEHASAGANNENAVEVAGEVLRHIRRAEAVAAALGSTAKVRVKIDAIGIGWYLPDILNAWRSEGMHDAEVIGVNVSEKPLATPDSATMRPFNQRAEAWLALRALLQPGTDGFGRLRLAYLEQRARAQLSGPKRLTNSSGYTVIERKEDMKKRGLRSPDRGDAMVLAIYEPQQKPKRGKLIV